jgi:L-lysine 2,3-aminomutase
MSTSTLKSYIQPVLEADLSHVDTIRIGTKALGFWPYRFLTDIDADDLLRFFTRIVRAGKNLALMAHFNHPRELATDVVREAIARIRETGAQIRTQSPLLRHINASSRVWSEMWKTQVALGCIPYYMFVARDTGAQSYFSIPLVDAWSMFKEAYSSVSGLARSVQGPVMSTHPGKVHILGVGEMDGRRIIAMRLIQGRVPDWVDRPFFAEYDEAAVWFDELRPAGSGSKFFFQDELDALTQPAWSGYRAAVKSPRV